MKLLVGKRKRQEDSSVNSLAMTKRRALSNYSEIKLIAKIVLIA